MSDILAHNLTMQFDQFTAVGDVSFTVAQGEFVTLLGPSGCGKTTLLKMISGFLHPTAGRIHIGGVDVTRTPPEHRDTALCFQSYALFPHMTVRGNLEFGLRQKRVAGRDRVARVAQIAQQLSLEPQLDKLPNALSGGQQQRVALGRALSMQPSVILFDEPLSNLDAKLRDQVRLEIKRIQQDNDLTAVYVTHDQSEALALSDRVIVMRDGRIEQIATPENLYHAPATSFVADFIGNANVMPAEVIGEADGGGWLLDSRMGRLVSRDVNDPQAKHINIAWRPERAHVSPEGSLTGTVVSRAFQGHFTDLHVATGGQTYRLQVAASDAIVGGDITFALDPGDVLMLEPLR
ncbi:ABC transporter ATP-binding protein [Tateyamaria omphalii]|uniref:ABC transporter ATP-binding protein n=1 Tax=Tateyamaria omphalii TaxID=299262 RepID=A0A1P8MX19_9RHOB|nr:ABC transporter ATP-binding protein [Tateyamaria omphalii]APX12561.1 ABC transporter ATP-binding protein [Tateyamaria omphalii]